jgi:dTDP-4-amino-4,6-dideoxygalactose transaminase
LLDEWNERRTKIASIYQTELLKTDLKLPFVPGWAEPAWHLYVVQHPRREVLQKEMIKADIGTLIHYPIPPHLQEAYAGAKLLKGQFPLAEIMANQCVSLPIGPHLNKANVSEVIEACCNIMLGKA